MRFIITLIILGVATHVASSAAVVPPAVAPACSADDYRKLAAMDPVQAASRSDDLELVAFMGSLSPDQLPRRECLAQIPGANALSLALCTSQLGTANTSYQWCRFAAMVRIAATMAGDPMSGACAHNTAWDGLRALNPVEFGACIMGSSATWRNCLVAAQVHPDACIHCLASWQNQLRCATPCSGAEGETSRECHICRRLNAFAGTANCLAGDAPAGVLAGGVTAAALPTASGVTGTAPDVPAPAGRVAVETVAPTVVAPACSADDYRNLAAWDPAPVGTGSAEDHTLAFRTSLSPSNPCLAQIVVMDTVADQLCGASTVENYGQELCRAAAMFQIGAQTAGEGMVGECSSVRDRLRSLNPVALVTCLRGGDGTEARRRDCFTAQMEDSFDSRTCVSCLQVWEREDRCEIACGSPNETSPSCFTCGRLETLAGTAKCLAGPAPAAALASRAEPTVVSQSRNVAPRAPVVPGAPPRATPAAPNAPSLGHGASVIRSLGSTSAGATGSGATGPVAASVSLEPHATPVVSSPPTRSTITAARREESGETVDCPPVHDAVPAAAVGRDAPVLPVVTPADSVLETPRDDAATATTSDATSTFTSVALISMALIALLME